MQEAARSAAASSPSGKSGHSRAISSGPFSVRSALGKRRRPTRSTLVPSRMQVRTSCRGWRRRSWVWTSFTTATGMESRRPRLRTAAMRASSPAARWRDTVSARREPKASRRRAAAPASAPPWIASRPRARSATARKGSRGVGRPDHRAFRRLPLPQRRARVGLGEEPAEPGVPLAVHGEQGEPRRSRPEPVAGHLGADDEREPPLAGPGVGPHHAVDAATVGERQRLEPQVGGAVHQFLRVARPFQEGEAGTAAQLCVAGRHRALSRRGRGARAGRRARRGRSRPRPAPRAGPGSSRGRRARSTTRRRAARARRGRGRGGTCRRSGTR